MSHQPDSIVRIDLHGALDIRTIGGLHTELMQALSLHTTVHINSSNLESADISMIQLLIAARRSAQASGREILLHSPPAPALENVLSRGGFVQAEGEAERDPFWSGG
ncbi:MAG TPA: STAS domain-containing protein [Acetobacteraceae bacterium]|nr:STAS domain-containing protein [Acetobacteraceae bacterium]